MPTQFLHGLTISRSSRMLLPARNNMLRRVQLVMKRSPPSEWYRWKRFSFPKFTCIFGLYCVKHLA